MESDKNRILVLEFIVSSNFFIISAFSHWNKMRRMSVYQSGRLAGGNHSSHGHYYLQMYLDRRLQSLKWAAAWTGCCMATDTKQTWQCLPGVRQPWEAKVQHDTCKPLSEPQPVILFCIQNIDWTSHDLPFQGTEKASVVQIPNRNTNKDFYSS